MCLWNIWIYIWDHGRYSIYLGDFECMRWDSPDPSFLLDRSLSACWQGSYTVLHSFTSDITYRRRNTDKPKKICAQSAFGRCITGDRFVAVMPWSTMMHALHMLQHAKHATCLCITITAGFAMQASWYRWGFRHRTTQESDNHTYTV